MWVKQGNCPHCGKRVELRKKDNTLKMHKHKSATCVGSGQSGREVSWNMKPGRMS